MLSEQLLCLLLALQFCSILNSAVDVTVSSGDTAFLPCPLSFNYSKSMRISVKWLKNGVKESSLCTYFIYSNRTETPECRPRFTVNREPLGLNITDVKSSDAGLYTCLMTRVIPPPSEEKSVNLTLKVNVRASLTLQLMNSTNLSCVELLCSLQGFRPQQVNFTWTRTTQLLHHHQTSSMNSTLTLCKPNWTEGETLTCDAIFLHNHTLYSKSITLPGNSAGYMGNEVTWLIAAVVSICAGLLLFVLLGVAICKWKKRDAANGPVVYRNKIYENFSLPTATINPTARSQNAQPGAGSNIRSTTRYNPQTVRQTQREECIYEN